jgi:hypothetical protein
MSPEIKNAFDPETVTAMATALELVCAALRINGDAIAREVIATRIIKLARRGEDDAEKLRDRVLSEANGESAPLADYSDLHRNRAVELISLADKTEDQEIAAEMLELAAEQLELAERESTQQQEHTQPTKR